MAIYLHSPYKPSWRAYGLRGWGYEREIYRRTEKPANWWNFLVHTFRFSPGREVPLVAGQSSGTQESIDGGGSATSAPPVEVPGPGVGV
jgi:hypothetical protein